MKQPAPLVNERAPLQWRLLGARGFFGLLLALVPLLFFQGTFAYIYETWGAEEYSHGFLIVPLALLLFLQLLKDVKPASTGLTAGLLLGLACLIMQSLFVIGNVRGLQAQMLLLFLWSLTLCFYGLRGAWRTLPAFGLLFFALPLPRALYYSLSLSMQSASTTLGVAFLDLLGITSFQDGNIIDLGIHKLQVVEACNGLRYLFPLTAFGYLLALGFKAHPIKRLVLLTSALPLTIFINGLRLMIIGLTVTHWGPAMAEGTLHDAEGWALFALGVGLLFGEIAILNRIGTKAPLVFDWLALPDLKNLPAFHATKRRAALFLILTLCGLWLAFEGKGWVQTTPLQKPLTSFPLTLGAWTGTRSPIDSASLAVLGTDDYLLADYTNAEGVKINLYILYYPKQDGTSNQAVHTPTGCLPAGGWQIAAQSENTLMTPTNPIQVSKLVATKGSQKALITYWYQQDDATVANGAAARLSILRNALFKGRTNGALIRLVAPIETDEATAKAHIQRFLDEGGLAAIESNLRTRQRHP